MPETDLQSSEVHPSPQFVAFRVPGGSATVVCAPDIPAMQDRCVGVRIIPDRRADFFFAVAWAIEATEVGDLTPFMNPNGYLLGLGDDAKNTVLGGWGCKSGDTADYHVAKVGGEPTMVLHRKHAMAPASLAVVVVKPRTVDGLRECGLDWRVAQAVREDAGITHVVTAILDTSVDGEPSLEHACSQVVSGLRFGRAAQAYLRQTLDLRRYYSIVADAQ